MRRPGQTYVFGDFRLDPRRRLLSSRSSPAEAIALPAAAFDTLVQLVEQTGAVVGRDVLLAAVWPHATVVDNSVNQAVAALRRALGDDPDRPRYVATVTGRGYRFTAPVSIEDGAERDPETYQLFVAGWSALTRPERATLAAAQTVLEAAVERDPGFGLALACLAECYMLQAGHGVRQSAEVFPKARAAAMAAIDADPRSAEAHAVLSHIRFSYDFDMDGAAEAMARSLELDPGCFLAYRLLTAQLMCMGRFDEALAAARRGQTIEPLAVSINGNIGSVLYFAGRYEEALAQFEHTLRMDQSWVNARSNVGRCHMWLGRFDLAMAAFEHPANREFGRPSDTLLAQALAGRADAARAGLRRLAQRPDGEQAPPIELACVHAVLGEHDAALAFVDEVIAERANALILAVEPALRGLHSDPRFRARLASLGLGDVLRALA
jgi:DNA-binding winged helix-turn-helix (wHTH) protein/Tfp pilus assembly protein PilF